jgi:hypothetical protein
MTIGQTYKADAGIILDESSDGNYTADCTFTNIRMEGGINRGVWIQKGNGNLFLGGTSEGCVTGVDIQESTQRNKFVELWCEGNTTSDLVVHGFLNSFDSCNLLSAGAGNTVEIPSGQATRFRDSFVRVVNLQSTSAQTVFDGCAFSDNVALGIKGTRTYRTFACVKVSTAYSITEVIADS